MAVAAVPVPAPPAPPSKEVEVLTEIREILKQR
jgi:hypothetical protein